MATNPERFFRAVQERLIDMVLIRAGSFTMGSPADEQDQMDYEQPQTVVTLTRGFKMGKYFVTQGEYSSLMNTNPSYFCGDADRPVGTSSWADANQLLRALDTA